MSKHARRKRKISSGGADVTQRTKVSLKIRIVALLILLSVGGLLLAGYAFGPDRRWSKIFPWGGMRDRSELQELWTQILQLEGCLLGRQNYCEESVDEGSILDHPLCRKMLRGHREEIGTFLVERMASQRETNIHTCPYLLAKEGELALYFLQHLTQTNWFDYPGEHPALRHVIQLRQKQGEGDAEDGPSSTGQQLLWSILDDPGALEELQQHYLQKLRKH